jgi:allantoicase
LIPAILLVTSPAAVLEACYLDGAPDEKTVWTALLPAVSLGGNAHHFFPLMMLVFGLIFV